MNGYDIYSKATIRLGYTPASEGSEFSSETLAHALELINQIISDLKLEPIKSLSDDINCSDEQAEALCCGTAMLLSFIESDTEKNQIYTNIYNAKRASALSKTEHITDTLPTPESDGV